MIPKKIHYCWFGGKDYPQVVKKCIDSWYKMCPDYEIIKWSEENVDIKSSQFMAEAYEQKKWAFVSDYARLEIVYNHGGIYLDTDVELIRNLDDLLDQPCFVASDGNGINTGLGFGAERYNASVLSMMHAYDGTSFIKEDGTLNLRPSTYYNTLPFENGELDLCCSQLQQVNGTTIYPQEYFSPKDAVSLRLNITERTHGIHWESRLWETGMTRFKARIRLMIGISATRRIKIVLRLLKKVLRI